MQRKLLLLIVLLPLLVLTAAAQTPEQGLHPLVDYIRLSPDQIDLSPEDVLLRKDWQPAPQGGPNFGYVTDVFWYRIELPALPGRHILEVGYPHLDDIRFWQVTDGQLTNPVQTGDLYPFSQRPLQHHKFLFPAFTDHPGEHQLLLRIETQGAHHVPIRLWDPALLYQKISAEDQLHALYYGIMITITLFSLVIFVALRERVYLFYLLATLSFLLMVSSLRGITFPLLWPGNPAMQNFSILTAIPSATICILLFTVHFLRLKDTRPGFYWLANAAMSANLLALAGPLVLPYNTAIWLSVSIALPTSLLLTLIGPWLWLQRHPQAGTYTLAWGALTLGSLITGANMYGLLPNNFITLYGIQAGSAIQATVLTIALAGRVYREREAAVRAREARIAALSAQRRAEKQVMEQAMRDPLTGLPNRSSFELRANQLLATPGTQRWAIGVIQLNNLDAITKTLGHRSSASLLEITARKLNSIVAGLSGIQLLENDGMAAHIAVLESSVFAFILDARKAASAPRQVARGLEKLREPVDYLGMQLPLDPKLGIALSPDYGTDTNTLIRQAYVALESGAEDDQDRGFAFYDPARDPYSAERLTLVTDLQQALEAGQLALWYQPKLNLQTRSVTGVEALIRWPGRLPAISPDQLIAVAEQSGLIRPLTRWVLDQALEARNQLLQAGHDLTVSINISPNNLRETDFPAYVRQLMGHHKKHRGRIILEITETSMMQDPANSLHALRSLDFAGIPLAIDDFGSGYSSLSYIKQLPAREIKIDRSLITDLRTHADDRVIVKTTIDMCHNLGYKVVAEGVEDEATLALLRDMGCDMAQGFVLARPQPMDSLLAALAGILKAGGSAVTLAAAAGPDQSLLNR